MQNYDEYSLITASYLSGDTEKVQDHLLKIFGNTSFDEQELKRMQKSRLGMEECFERPSLLVTRVVFTLFPDENDARRTNYTKSDDVVTDTQQLRNAQESILIQNIQLDLQEISIRKGRHNGRND